jgi:hypothetical protein
MNAILPSRPVVIGLAEADRVLDVAKGKLASMTTRLAQAEAAIAAATDARATLVASVVSGATIKTAAARSVGDALRDAEADAGILRDALPTAEAEVKAAEVAVTDVLTQHMKRLHVAAAERQTAAESRLEIARIALQGAGDIARQAGHLVTMSETYAHQGISVERMRQAILDFTGAVIG